MYSANDWRNYTLLHADKVGKWEWPGGNNSKAYNEWYYSHHKDKWRQYYLNKKKQGGENVTRNMGIMRNAIKDLYAGNRVYNPNTVAGLRGQLAIGAMNTLNNRNPEAFRKTRDLTVAAINAQNDAHRIRTKLPGTFGPDGYSSYAYQDAAEYPEQQTPSRGASRRRQTR